MVKTKADVLKENELKNVRDSSRLRKQKVWTGARKSRPAPGGLKYYDELHRDVFFGFAFS